MATITEDYVSFETAKMLKEKGFPQDPAICNMAYTINGKLSNNAKSFLPNSSSIIPSRCYTIVPTQQMACRWLREVHNISVEIASRYTLSRDGVPLNWYWSARVIKLKTLNKPILVCRRDTFEEACEAAIKYALENLI